MSVTYLALAELTAIEPHFTGIPFVAFEPGSGRSQRNNTQITQQIVLSRYYSHEAHQRLSQGSVALHDGVDK